MDAVTAMLYGYHPLTPLSTHRQAMTYKQALARARHGYKKNLGDALSHDNFNRFEVLFLTQARQQVFAAG